MVFGAVAGPYIRGRCRCAVRPPPGVEKEEKIRREHGERERGKWAH